jgi:hypothetical protein
MENEMEPDDNKWIQSIMDRNYHGNSYTFAQEYQDLIKTVVQQNRDGTISKHVDLSDVSTRDLLNECYRRRAIEKFTYKVDADMYFLKQEPQAREYLIKDLTRGMWESMLKNEKFSQDAISIKEEQNNPQIRTEFYGEVYICKHPTKVRK